MEEPPRASRTRCTLATTSQLVSHTLFLISFLGPCTRSCRKLFWPFHSAPSEARLCAFLMEQGGEERAERIEWNNVSLVVDVAIVSVANSLWEVEVQTKKNAKVGESLCRPLKFGFGGGFDQEHLFAQGVCSGTVRNTPLRLAHLVPLVVRRVEPRVELLGQPKISQTCVAVAVQQNVLGLQVPMNYLVAVEVTQRQHNFPDVKRSLALRRANQASQTNCEVFNELVVARIPVVHNPPPPAPLTHL